MSNRQDRQRFIRHYKDTTGEREGEDSFWKGYDPLLVALALYAVTEDHYEGTKIIQAAFRDSK